MSARMQKLAVSDGTGLTEEWVRADKRERNRKEETGLRRPRMRRGVGLGLPRIAPKLYKAARMANTFEAWLSLDPMRILRRYRNKIIGRTMMKRGRLGSVWGKWF